MPEKKSGRFGVTGVVSLAVSVLLLVVLYRTLDVRQIAATLLGSHKAWLLGSVSLIVPITVLRALRFYWIAPAGALPGVGEALRLTLVASALNVFLPAKSGDLVKSYFVGRHSDTRAGVAVAIIVYERLCDLFALITWCILGWVIARPDVPGLPAAFWLTLAAVGGACGVLLLSKRTAAVPRLVLGRLLPAGKWRRLRDAAAGWPDLMQMLRGRRRWIVLFSLLLWLAHLFQLWTFTIALSVTLPFLVSASLSALALMAGQLPLTIAGLGTRDLALVVLLARYMAPESAAAMGVLISTRNLLPPLLGLPIMRPYVTSVVDQARQWRRQLDSVA